jgi:Peptidase family C25/Secretion system C-terminal sorting domain
MTTALHGFKRFFVVASLILFSITNSFCTQEQLEKKIANWKIQSSTADGFTAQISISNSATQSSSSSLFNISEDEEFDFVASTLIAVPNGRGLQINVSDSDINRGDIVVGTPFLFRGIRLFPVLLKPSMNNRSELENSSKTINFEASFTNSSPFGNSNISERNFTAEGMKFLRTHVMNLDELNLNVIAPLGRILIMVQDNENTIANLHDYVQWKTQQGYKVVVDHPVDPSNHISIREKIEEHYFNDDPLPLEYILMIGDHEGTIFMSGDPDLDNPISQTPTDYLYTMFDSEDSPVGTVAIGRFSADTPNQLLVEIKKTITYERDVHMENTTWLSKVVLTAGEWSGVSPIQVNRRIKQMFWDRGVAADTLWFTMNNGQADWQIPEFIINQVNDGASFVNYRGSYGMSGWTNEMCDQFTNRFTLPVIVTITCNTGTWGQDFEGVESFTETFLRAGTVNIPKGAVAAIGTADVMTHTCYNNIVSVGICDAFLQNDIRSLGWALVSAKYRLWEAYNGHGRNDNIKCFSNWNNLMGDPALRMWVGVPEYPTVIHQDTVFNGDTSLDVSVTIPGEWPELVWATIATDDTVIDSRVVPNGGNVRLYFDSLPQDENVYLTVCGDNVIPQIDTLRTASAEVLLVTTDIVIDDGESGDFVANPGETVILDLTLTNSGTEDLTGATAIVTSEDPYLNLITASSFDVPTLATGSSITIEDAVTIELDGFASDGYSPELTLLLNDTQRSAIRIEITSWVSTSQFKTPIVDESGDNIFLPGETVEISFPVSNIGSSNGVGLTGDLSSSSSGINVTNDQRSFIDMGIQEESNNHSDPFSVTASNTLRIGEKVDFTLRLTDDSGAKDSSVYTIYMGDPASNGLTGPDQEYWAVDEFDTDYPPQIDFNWIDIESTENRTVISDAGENMDSSIVMNLPFPFTYYGETFEEITICSNGWAAFGSQGSQSLQRNWPIPNPMGPKAMLAPFWENLELYASDGVYTFFASDNNMFIITWDCRNPNGGREKFQIVLFDPAYHSTVTGNGIILFQYDEITYTPDFWVDNDFATIGIESPDSKSGVMYEYWRTSQPGATELGFGTNRIHTIVFTDDLTANFFLDVDDNGSSQSAIPTEFAISEVYPNPFNPSTTISVALPNSGNLKLKIFNLLGQEVAELTNKFYSAGMQKFTFDADKMASGIYFVQASLPGSVTKTQKIMLVR